MKNKKILLTIIILIILSICSIFAFKTYSYKKSSKYKVENFINQMSKEKKSSQDKDYWNAYRTYTRLDYCEDVKFSNIEKYTFCKKFITQEYDFIYHYIFKYKNNTQAFVLIKWDVENETITELYLDELREHSIN